MGATSWQVKAKYNNQHYKRVAVDLDRELVLKWEESLSVAGVSKAEFIRNAIEKYLSEQL